MKTVEIYGVTYTGQELEPGVFEFTRQSKRLNENRISDNGFAFEYMDDADNKTAHSAAKRAIRFMFI